MCVLAFPWATRIHRVAFVFAPPFTERKTKLAENKIITDGVEEEMEKWQVEEGDKHMHRGTQQDCWGLNRTRRFRRHRRLWKSKHSTWFCRWSKNPRVKPAVFVSCSHYPPGEWGATKTLLPPHPTYAVLSMSRELTDSDWQLVLFWFWCAFIFFYFLLRLAECVGLFPFFTLCLSDVSCSNIQ